MNNVKVLVDMKEIFGYIVRVEESPDGDWHTMKGETKTIIKFAINKVVLNDFVVMTIVIGKYLFQFANLRQIEEAK